MMQPRETVGWTIVGALLLTLLYLVTVHVLPQQSTIIALKADVLQLKTQLSQQKSTRTEAMLVHVREDVKLLGDMLYQLHSDTVENHGLMFQGGQETLVALDILTKAVAREEQLALGVQLLMAAQTATVQQVAQLESTVASLEKQLVLQRKAFEEKLAQLSPPEDTSETKHAEVQELLHAILGDSLQFFSEYSDMQPEDIIMSCENHIDTCVFLLAIDVPEGDGHGPLYFKRASLQGQAIDFASLSEVDTRDTPDQAFTRLFMQHNLDVSRFVIEYVDDRYFLPGRWLIPIATYASGSEHVELLQWYASLSV